MRLEEVRPCTPTCRCAFEILFPCNPCHVRSWLQAVYTVRLEGETLHTLLEVTNTGDKPFNFTASLHRQASVCATSRCLGIAFGK